MNLFLKSSILSYLKERFPNWVSGLEIEKLALAGKFGNRVFKGETAGRRARELAEDWIIEKTEERGFVEYKARGEKIEMPPAYPQKLIQEKLEITHKRSNDIRDNTFWLVDIGRDLLLF